MQSVLKHTIDFVAGSFLRSTHPDIVKEIDFVELLSSANQSELLNKISTIVKASTNITSPGFIGHMDSIPTTASIVGDLIAATLNNNMLFCETSQCLTPMENYLIKEFIERFGFNRNQAGGILLSGGTLSNLQALAVARNKVINCINSGIDLKNLKAVIYTSEAVHTSIEKAAMLLGLGTDAVIKIPVDNNSNIKINLLENEIQRSKKKNYLPICIVATAGTTVTGSIDPLEEVISIGEKHGIWVHVDAAYGGALRFSRSHTHKLKGIEKANSITFNPHKWMYVARTCSMVLFANQIEFEQNFRIAAPYSGPGNHFLNIGEISVQGSNHADVLKLWLSIQHIGWKGYEKLIDYTMDLANKFQNKVSARPDLTLLNQPQTNIVCFRAEPKDVSPDQWNHFNIALQRHLQEHCNIFLSIPKFNNKRILRAVLLNPFFDEQLLTTLFNHIDNFIKK